MDIKVSLPPVDGTNKCSEEILASITLEIFTWVLVTKEPDFLVVICTIWKLVHNKRWIRIGFIDELEHYLKI